ncbi:carbohydrate kinase [Lysobacter sp. Root916]|uniref:bifunctional ADP-dependent NAD(P)H-hydrate dehydratase/NAD(P)H-hydrate epimerase n=1 Tax=Lysobacter sp. Root916 TaxID=1736606 RepID=UPI00070F4E7C|nr:bifunctional ADP-dependent NAD(P)H-hydrate dehydratase/NAD(P)H-hydrate epimerase [Lysobacter sp. Root916]KRD40055.1 carbohydrate kinase [Lysobacter sp. Root916]
MPTADFSFDSGLYDTAALRAVEARASAHLGDAYELMRRAGAAGWRELLRRWPAAQRIVVVCGPGNNGGDGYVLATHAQASGREVRVSHLAAHAPRGELARRAADAYTEAGGRSEVYASGALDADLIVDALFGIGLSRAPDAEASALIETINAQSAPVFALDVPSGVDAERGVAYAPAVIADATIEFIAHKFGLSTGSALDCVGSLAWSDLQLSVEAFDRAPVARSMRAEDLRRWLSPRERDSHKGRNGRVLCVGGDHGSGGAIVLCAQAALRSGAGLVEIATRGEHVQAVLARIPEAMPREVRDAAQLRDALERASMIALGPGLGQGAWARDLQACVLESQRPLLLDADALNLLAERPRTLHADCVLTPHPGEAARLLGIDTAQVQADRLSAARALRDRYACAIVLKGAGTIVTAPDAEPRVIAAGNPGMSVGGMGDVLSGTIAALRAQGLNAFDAAVCGALLHSAAADAAARDGGERGLLPTDLMPWLRRLANPESSR